MSRATIFPPVCSQTHRPTARPRSATALFAPLPVYGVLRDRFLAPLRAKREELLKESDVGKVLMECVVQGMATDSNLERTFWLDVIVEPLRALPDTDREQRFVHTAQLIVASAAVPSRARQDAVRFVADRLVPLK